MAIREKNGKRKVVKGTIRGTKPRAKLLENRRKEIEERVSNRLDGICPRCGMNPHWEYCKANKEQ